MKVINLTVDTSFSIEPPELTPASGGSFTPSSRKVLRKTTPTSMEPSPKLEALYHATKSDEANFLNYNFNVLFYGFMWSYYVFCILQHTLDWKLPVAVAAGMYLSDFASACLHIYLDHR